MLTLTLIDRSMSILTRISAKTDERSARLAGVGLMLLSIFMFSFGASSSSRPIQSASYYGCALAQRC